VTGCERTEGEPECRRICKLAAQFIAKQQIVQRDQHDPVRQSNDADEENPGDYAAHDGSRPGHMSRFGCVSRSARGISAATIAASAVNPSNQ
jgi:hypothetical protein